MSDDRPSKRPRRTDPSPPPPPRSPRLPTTAQHSKSSANGAARDRERGGAERHGADDRRKTSRRKDDRVREDGSDDRDRRRHGDDHDRERERRGVRRSRSRSRSRSPPGRHKTADRTGRRERERSPLRERVRERERGREGERARDSRAERANGGGSAVKERAAHAEVNAGRTPRGHGRERDGHEQGVGMGATSLPAAAASKPSGATSGSATSAAPPRNGVTGTAMDTDMDTPGEHVDEEVEDEDAARLRRMMGFAGFRSTKNTKVPGNDRLYGVRRENMVEYRQYMNRVGGFNRPLSPGR